MANVDNRLTRTFLFLLPALLAFAACGGGGTPHVTGTAGSGPGAAGTGAGIAGSVGGTAGVTGAAGAGSGMAGVTGAAGTGSSVAVCTNYCNKIMANCTGANQQYADMANCLKVCTYMPAGAPADDGVNTANCRANAAAAAATAADATATQTKCFAAGPLSYGACGSDCDVFCATAVSYCGASAGYKSIAECSDTCGQFNRVIDFAAPGHYGATYTPGPTPATKDTLECRAFYLFINALQSTAGQQTNCPIAANVSSVCGPGVVPIVVDPDAGAGSDAAVIKYDGGNIINPSNWNETMYPPTKRKMLLRDEGDPHMVMIDLSKTPVLVWKVPAEGPWARASQLIGNNQILGGTSNGYQVWDYSTGAVVKTVNGFGNTQSAYRLATGETMLTQSGTVLTFLDKTDKKAHQISYPGYGYVRVARPTRNGTFLVPSDTQLFEGDATGKVLWHTSGAGWSHIWMPLLLGPPVGGGKWKNGDTLLCTAFGSSCDVVDQTSHMVTFRFGGKAMTNAAMIHPNFFSEFEILPNGNIFTANWQGHGGGNGNSGIQVLEFDPTGTVTWFWKQDPTIFSSIQGVQSMDGKDPMKLHVQETSTDSTWQPVPTP